MPKSPSNPQPHVSGLSFSIMGLKNAVKNVSINCVFSIYGIPIYQCFFFPRIRGKNHSQNKNVFRRYEKRLEKSSLSVIPRFFCRKSSHWPDYGPAKNGPIETRWTFWQVFKIIITFLPKSPSEPQPHVSGLSFFNLWVFKKCRESRAIKKSTCDFY